MAERLDSATIQNKLNNRSLYISDVSAVKSISGEYFLHGHLQAEPARLVLMGGAEFLHVRHEFGMETLTARGPLIEPLIIEVCVSSLQIY